MTTTTTLPERRPLSPQSTERLRDTAAKLAPWRAAVRPPGTRNGWAMRLVYVLSDLIAFGASLAVAKSIVDLSLGIAISAITSIDLKLAALWIIGLAAVAAAQKTYAPIPPRPVRKFRGWVEGAMIVCMAVVGGAWLLGVGTAATYLTLILASCSAVLLASFCRAVCRIAFGSAAWWGTRLIVVGSGALAARTRATLSREPQWGLRPIGFVEDS